MLVDTTNVIFVFFNDTATTEIYTLSLHDALPIWSRTPRRRRRRRRPRRRCPDRRPRPPPPRPSRGRFRGRRRPRRPRRDRKSTRLNSSHANISYAVFCLKKKKNTTQHMTMNALHG